LQDIKGDHLDTFLLQIIIIPRKRKNDKGMKKNQEELYRMLKELMRYPIIQAPMAGGASTPKLSRSWL
jgi:hypothetical protein